jgi:L-ascorbate metabolism protein UlaG (beta-lactamase superfamily)
LAAIPIGAYKPKWFMRPQHIDPDEAHTIHQMVKSKLSIGIHWGTFILTDEPIMEPKMWIEKIRKEAGDDGTSFIVLEHGQSIAVP